MSRRFASRAAAALLALALSPGLAGAQSLWLPRDRPCVILIEGLHPSIEGTDPGSPTGAAFLGGRFKLGQGAAVVLEGSFARFEGVYYENRYWTFQTVSDTYGNPYVGFEFGSAKSIFFTELGARVPVADEKEWVALQTGIYADPSRFDAFVVDAVPIHLVFNIREVMPSGLMARLRFGTLMIAPTKDRIYRDDEFYAVFAWQVGYESKSFRIGSAVSGRSLLSEDSGNLGALTSCRFEAHADFGTWLRPGVEVKVPIGSLANTVPVILGASIGVAF